MLLVGCVKVTVVLLITHLSALKLQAKLITLAVVLSQTHSSGEGGRRTSYSEIFERISVLIHVHYGFVMPDSIVKCMQFL